MEKAILRTLAYSDIFEYPLTLYEIHKWLVGRKLNLRQVEKAILMLKKKRRINQKGDFYFLGRRDSLVSQRRKRGKQSQIYLRKAKILAGLLKIIPWIKLVGISGGLAMENAQKSDDIDFFIITAGKRMWLARLFILLLLSFTGQRRQVQDGIRRAAGKICVNTILEEDALAQQKKDIYLAHEVLQMKMLWERDGIYAKYLTDNEWVFKFLPNWVGAAPKLNIKYRSFQPKPVVNVLENLAKWFQKSIMQPKQGEERVEEEALYFHPNDCREKVLAEYKKRIKGLKS